MSDCAELYAVATCLRDATFYPERENTPFVSCILGTLVRAALDSVLSICPEKQSEVRIYKIILTPFKEVNQEFSLQCPLTRAGYQTGSSCQRWGSDRRDGSWRPVMGRIQVDSLSMYSMHKEK